METKHAIVIDSSGCKVEFVLVSCVDGESNLLTDIGTPLPKTTHLIDSYSLKDGESLVFEDVSTALSMIAPRWTGANWEETGTKDITPELVEELRVAKLQEVNNAAQQAIHAGITIGEYTFTLTETDQMNITNLAGQLQAALRGEESTIDPAKGVPYHANGELCRPWPAEEFVRIAQAATAHVFYHQTYCNHLRQHTKDIASYDDLAAAHYGMELPAELAASMGALMGVAAS